jgi:hypothetical protein
MSDIYKDYSLEVEKVLSDNLVYTPLTAQVLKVGDMCPIHGIIAKAEDRNAGKPLRIYQVTLVCDEELPFTDSESKAYIRIDDSDEFCKFMIFEQQKYIIGKRASFIGKVIKKHGDYVEIYAEKVLLIKE